MLRRSADVLDLRREVAGQVVDVERDAGVGGGDLHEPSEVVEEVVGRLARRVGDLLHVREGVVGEARRVSGAAADLRDLFQAVEGVVEAVVVLPVLVRDPGRVALRVVAVLGEDRAAGEEGVERLQHPPRRIEAEGRIAL